MSVSLVQVLLAHGEAVPHRPLPPADLQLLNIAWFLFTSEQQVFTLCRCKVASRLLASSTCRA